MIGDTGVRGLTTGLATLVAAPGFLPPGAKVRGAVPLTIDVKNMDLRIKNIKNMFYPIIKNMEKTLQICFHVDSVTPKSSTCAGVVMYRVVPKY